MAVSKGTKITKTDVINHFNTTIIDYVYSGTPWHSGNYPKTATATTITENWSGTVVAAGVNLIPSGQLDANTKPSLSSIGSDTKLTAATVVNALKNAANAVTRVRKCTVNWYHTEDTTDALKQTNTNKAIFLATTSAVSGTTRPYFTKSPDTTAMTSTLSPATSNVASSQVASANNMITFINNIKTAWDTAYASTVTYTYYTCHNQCYTAPCQSRGRR